MLGPLFKRSEDWRTHSTAGSVESVRVRAVGCGADDGLVVGVSSGSDHRGEIHHCEGERQKSGGLKQKRMGSVRCGQ